MNWMLASMNTSHTAEVVVGLLVLVTAVVWLSSRLAVPYPILLVLGGLLIALVPGLPDVPLQTDIFFLMFLPPLLYRAALQTSWRDFRADIRPISMLAIGLVLVTMTAIAAVSHYVVGLPWAAGFALGAIISPPDAIAATSVMQRLRLPKRITTILEGESLVNDATALVAYKFAIAAMVLGEFSLPMATLQFFLVSIGGIVIGYFVGMILAWLRPRIRDDSVDMLVSLLAPFIAYLPAEWCKVSGVLAVVTCGLYMGRKLPRIVSSHQRLRLFAVWEALTFLLNGVVFVLIGLQLPGIVRRIEEDRSATLLQTCIYALLIAGVAIVVRLAFVFPLAMLPRMILPGVRQRDPMPSFEALFLVGWAGMRGIVSLAAAMALPLVIDDKMTPLPRRDEIIFVTFGVILVTLVGQGLSLPAVIRKLGFAPEDANEREETLARRELAYAALGRLDSMEFMDEVPKPALAEVRAGYELRIKRFNQRIDGSDSLAEDPCDTQVEIELEALAAERAMLIKLRDDEMISDDVLRHVQNELDIAEMRLRSEKSSSEPKS